MAKTPEAKIKFSVFNEDFKKGINEITKDTTRLRKEFKLEAEQMKNTASEVGKLEQNIRRLSAEKENVRKKIELTEKQLEKAKEHYGENSDEVRRLTNQLLDLQVSEQKIENAIDDSTRAIEKQSDAMTESIPDAKKYRESLAEIGETAIKVGDKIQTIGKGMSDFGKSYSMRVTAPIVAGGTAMFKAAMDYESAFAGVRKTVDATEEEFQELSTGIRNMAKELPASANDIAAVGEAAGQLGIKTENILEFTRTMIDLGEATNMTSETAATEFARFANIVGMSQQDFDKLGSVVVDLGNNLATTEAEIVEMAMRLAGAGAQIGLTEAEIMAFSGSLSSVGIAAEAGGSAFSKVMVNMQLAAELGGEDLKAFADVAGMSAKEFKTAFEKDAAGAMISFIKGLETAEDRGMSAIAVLDDMGITEVRMRDALLRAAGASDVFTDAIEMGSSAWDENIALTEEAEQRYATTESQLKIMWNRIKDVAITVGESLVPAVMSALDAAEPFIEKIEEGAEAFSEMDEEQQRNILKLIALVAAIGPASMALGGMTTVVGGVVKTGGSFLSLLGKAGGPGLLGRLGTMGLTAGPVGIAIAGVTGLGLAIYALSEYTDVNYKKTSDAIDKRMEELDALDESIERYEELQKKNKLSTDEVLRYMDIMDELKNAKSEEAIAKLTAEQEDLLKKSTLTNAEMEEFLGLNDTLVQNSPAVAEAISEQGNAYLETTEAVKNLSAAERERELANLYVLITEEMDEQVRNLEKQASYQEEITRLETERVGWLEKIKVHGDEIKRIDSEIAEIDAEKLGLTIEERDVLRDKLSVLEDERNGHEVLLQTGNEKLASLDKQVGKEQDKLDNINDQINGYNALIDQYEIMLLQQHQVVDEHGNAYQSIQDAKQGLHDQRMELIRLFNAQEISTEEYEKGIGKIQAQEKALEGVQAEADILNSKLGEDINKKVGLNTSPSISALNRDLTSPITRIMNIRTYGATPISAYATGTNYHPGGKALVGEEGPELIREGRKWSLADLGIYNLKRGAQVFTNEQTNKILSIAKRLPKYADGVGVTNDMSSNLDRISSGLAERRTNNNTIVTIEASDVIIDGRIAGQVLWKPVKENIDRSHFRGRRRP